MAGIYVHIPFCKRKCLYCDFYSTAQFGEYSRTYLAAAVKEMECSKDYIGGEAVETLYFGGGTPSLYSPDQIGEVAGSAERIFGHERLSEITLESNPEDINLVYLAGLIKAGVNRLSIGVQSFDNGLLTFMKRRHNGERAEESVRLARQAGFNNIGIDLIYGIPGLSPALWEHTLETALALRPEHISAYHLTFEPYTTLGRMQAAGKIEEIPQEESQMQFKLLHYILTSEGYEHYEVSNFARPGYRSRHNSSYWTGAKYLGIGPGAHSFNGVQRRWCQMSLKEYISGCNPVYSSETLTPDDVYNELVMTSLRCADGLSVDRINSKAGKKYADYFLPLADELTSRRILQREGQKYYILPSDFLISDTIISSLFV